MGVPFDKLRALSLSKRSPVCGTGVAARLGLSTGGTPVPPVVCNFRDAPGGALRAKKNAPVHTGAFLV
jgi:hypothetical protein